MTREEQNRISRAIVQAEDGTTGRIAVRIIPDKTVDAFERAVREFGRTGLHLYEHENAALVFVAPKARKFAVIGDRALHERVGDAFWNDVVAAVQPYFARDAVVDGIVEAIRRIGSELHAHFPES